MTTLNTSRFTWSSKNRCFVAFVSDLSDTRIDDTIKLVNPKTNNSLIFNFDMVERDDDNDIILFKYKSESNDITMELFND